MASGSWPHHLAIHNTSATEGGQNFAGVNLGTINYANGEDRSSKHLGFKVFMMTLN